MQVPIQIRYFFTNTRDRSHNYLFWDEGNPEATVGEIQKLLLRHRVIDRNCHVRFKDKIKGMELWLDISNQDAPAPMLQANLVDVKIVRQFYAGSQAFQHDMFGAVIGNSGNEQKEYAKLVNKIRKMMGLGEISRDENAAPTFEDIDFGEQKDDFEGENSDNQEDQYEEPEVDDENEIEEILNGNANRATEGYMIFDSGKQAQADDFLGVSDLHMDDLKPANPSPGFVLDFDEAPKPPRKVSEVDFLEGGSGGNHNPRPKKASNDLGGLEDLEGGVFGTGPAQPRSNNNRKKKPTATSGGMNSGSGGILDLNLDLNPSANPNSEHGRQIQFQEEKLRFANEIDPLVKSWQKDPKNGTDKDIRSLMISLKPFLEKFGVSFNQIKLTQVMSDGAVRKTYYKTIRSIHPDKVSETDPRLLYLYERVSEAVTLAFKKHKSNK